MPKERKVGRRQPSQQSVELLIEVDFFSEKITQTENCEYIYVLKAMYLLPEYTFLCMFTFVHGSIQHSAPWIKHLSTM